MSALATTFSELFDDNLPVASDKIFLIDPARSYTYCDVARERDRVAAWLIRCGVKRGDRVIVQLRKSMREVAAMLAVARVGAIFVNLSVALTDAQLRFVADDCGAHAMILEPRAAQQLSDSRPRLISGEEWDALPPSHSMISPTQIDTDLAAIIYTSGSTGQPKGVMLSHRSIVAGARSVARYLHLAQDDRLLSVLPYSFDYGLNQLTTMMLMGGTVVHQPVAMPSEIVNAMRAHAVTGLAGVPPLWIQIVRLLEAAPCALPALRRVTNSGGAIPGTILKHMQAAFPNAQVVLMYGLTEAFRSTYLPPERFAAKMGSIGQAVPGAEIHVIKHGVGVAGPGEQGELIHRGPFIAQGYWNRPEATAAKIGPCPELASLIGQEPVVHSGDIVRIDADGDLWFVGRTDALIKSSGFRISPDEVEDIVHASGMVADAVAFGVPDDLLGQCVHVAVTLLPGVDRDALMAHCRRAMPGYMVPHRLHVWPDAMPRTSSGKLARPDIVTHCNTRLAEAALPS